MLTRNRVIEALRDELAKTAAIRAATLGGSDANGRADEVSDVDLFLIVERGAIEDAAAAVERVLESLSPIAIKFRLPMPTWHGFHQAFYQLADAPEHLMIDWVIVEKGTPHPWFEVERHGTHRVLFDKDGAVVPAHMDRAAIDAAIAKKVAELRIKHAVFKHLPGKLAVRGEGGLPADAAYFYHALALRQLVDMLRAVHCPDRHDFGFRYLKDDLPRREYEMVCRLSYPSGPEAIGPNVREISGEIERLLGVWDEGIVRK